MGSRNYWPNFRQQTAKGRVKLLTDPAFWLPSGDPLGSYSSPHCPHGTPLQFAEISPDITGTPWLVLALALLVAFSIYLILRSKRK